MGSLDLAMSSLSQTAAMSIGLRDVQKKSLLRMLNLMNDPITIGSVPEEGDDASAWKILVLDAIGQAILSPILKVNELREAGVTLYLNLHGDRQAICDVPAVYFVEPTPTNISRIASDLSSKLYDQVYLNFTSSIPRSLLEDLAQQVAQSDSGNLVARVFDQYLNFECVEKDLFTFSMPGTYALLNSSGTADVEIGSVLDKVAGSLFGVFMTMGGQCPVIVASKGTAAEMVGSKLEKKLKSHLTNVQSSIIGESMMGDTIGLQRPLLVILDRNFDLCTPLKHVSTYNALVHDVLGMKLNRINLPDAASGSSKVFDIDSSDAFWQENAHLPFPTVAENVDSALNQYKADMQQVTRSSGVTDLEAFKASDHGATMTAEELKVAINVLPELTERKRLIDCHLQLATALLDQIRSRDLGNLFHLEQSQQELNKAALLGILRKPDAGNASDKMRLFLIYYLTNNPTSTDMLEYEKALRDAGCQMEALESVKKIKSMNKMMSLASPTTTTGPQSSHLGSNNPDIFSKITSTTTGVLGNLVSSVKNLLPESTETALTKQLDLALELTTGQSTTASMFRTSASSTSVKPDDILCLFDPRSKNPAGTATNTQLAAAFSHLIVFVVGGSNYSEYNHVQEYVKKRSSQQQLTMQATFGTTDLVTGAEFLQQISSLHP